MVLWRYDWIFKIFPNCNGDTGDYDIIEPENSNLRVAPPLMYLCCDIPTLASEWVHNKVWKTRNSKESSRFLLYFTLLLLYFTLGFVLLSFIKYSLSWHRFLVFPLKIVLMDSLEIFLLSDTGDLTANVIC